MYGILEWILLILFIFFIGSILNKFLFGVCKSFSCLIGKTAIVSGGNSGIGLKVVKSLASRGCKVIIADKDNAEETVLKIIKETDNPDIIYKYLDLGSFNSVRKFANDIIKSEKKLDILINNAGISFGHDKMSEDGINLLMQVNYFGPFLLTHLLIDLLKKSSPSRIIFTSSNLSLRNNIKSSNLTNPKLKFEFFEPTNLLNIYANSKVATIIASNEIASRLEGCGVTSNSLHPGIVKTPIFKKVENVNWFYLFLLNLWNNIFAKNSWEGAQTTLHLAMSKEVENTTGKYFSDCKTHFTPYITKNTKFCKTLYEESLKIVGLSEKENIQD